MISQRSNSIGTRNMKSFTIECNTQDCGQKENFTGIDETDAESKAWKRGWNVVRIGPSIAHYCPKCFKAQRDAKRDRNANHV